MKLTIKNWARFQHYKNRRPPWIKLHREFIDDYEFNQLPDSARALAPCLWLLASEYKDGVIPLEIDALAFRVHKPTDWTRDALNHLILGGFIHDASVMLADCLQHAIPEGEKRERETQRNNNATLHRKVPSQPPVHLANANTGEPVPAVAHIVGFRPNA